MAILNADFLLAHAHTLLASPEVGERLQIDLRRSISAAYYALFHTVATTAAEQALGGAATVSQAELALVVRTIGHSDIARICRELAKSSIAPRFAPYLPAGGFGPHLRAFMAAFPIVQEHRHQADYDIIPTYDRVMAIGIVESAVAARGDFWRAAEAERRAFLLLVLFAVRH